VLPVVAAVAADVDAAGAIGLCVKAVAAITRSQSLLVMPLRWRFATGGPVLAAVKGRVRAELGTSGSAGGVVPPGLRRVLDDITPLEQLTQARTSEITLFDIRPSISWRRFGPTNAQQGSKPFAAPNPLDGALISYFIKTASDHVKIAVTDRDGREIRQLDGTRHAGINRVGWDLRYPMPVQPSAEDRWAASERVLRWRHS
jgi:hypothetical protein